MTLNLAFFAAVVMPLMAVPRGAALKLPAYHTISRGILCGAAGALLIVIIGSAMGFSATDQMSAAFDEAAGIMAQNEDLVAALEIKGSDREALFESFRMMYSSVEMLLPSYIFFLAAVASYLEYLVFSKALIKRGTEVPAITPIREFDLPRNTFLPWILMYLIAYLIASGDFEAGTALCTNINVLMRMVFAYQGISLIFALFYSKHLPKVLAVLLCIAVLIFGSGMFLLFIVGIIDLAFGLKHRLRIKD